MEGQIRPRTEFRNGYKTLQSDSSSASVFIEQRSRLSVGYKNKIVELFISFQDVRVWGSTPLTNKVAGNFSLFQGWAKININHLMNFKVGRQVLSFDNQRILGGLDWAPQGRAHDAILFQYKNDSIGLDFQVGGAYNMEAASLNNIPYTVSGNYRTMQFIRLKKAFKFMDFMVLGMNIGRDYQDQINFELTAGALVNFKRKTFKATLEGYYQYGKTATDLRTNAYLLALKFHYKLKFLDFALGGDFLSGTDYNQQGIRNTSFNPWMGTNHIFYGHIDYFYVGNSHKNAGLVDAYATINYTPFNRLNLGLTYHYFHAPATIQELSTGQNANGHLGHELDFIFKYQVKKYFSIQGGYAHLFGAPTLEYLKPSGNVNTINNWAWLTLNVSLELFRHRIKLPVPSRSQTQRF